MIYFAIRWLKRLLQPFRLDSGEFALSPEAAEVLRTLARQGGSAKWTIRNGRTYAVLRWSDFSELMRRAGAADVPPAEAPQAQRREVRARGAR